MYIPDLRPFNFGPWTHPRFLAVGWLAEQHPFTKGEVPAQAVERLFALCAKPVYKTRGFHECPFCPKQGKGRQQTRNGKTIWLGSAMVRVRGRNWMTYFAPDLIYHYVVEHNYRPPEEFIEAVLRPRRFLTLNSLALGLFACSFVGVALAMLHLQTLALWFLAPMVIFVLVFGVYVILNGARAKLRNETPNMKGRRGRNLQSESFE